MKKLLLTMLLAFTLMGFIGIVAGANYPYLQYYSGTTYNQTATTSNPTLIYDWNIGSSGTVDWFRFNGDIAGESNVSFKNANPTSGFSSNTLSCGGGTCRSVVGLFGNATYFSGTNYLTGSASNTIRGISLWFKSDVAINNASTATPLTRHSLTGGAGELILGGYTASLTGEYITLAYLNSSGSAIQKVGICGAGSLTAGTWYNLIAIVNSSNNWNLYLNGVKSDNCYNLVGSGGSGIGATTLGVGVSPAGTIASNITIDDLQIYANAPSTAQINAIYNATKQTNIFSNTVAAGGYYKVNTFTQSYSGIPSVWGENQKGILASLPAKSIVFNQANATSIDIISSSVFNISFNITDANIKDANFTINGTTYRLMDNNNILDYQFNKIDAGDTLTSARDYSNHGFFGSGFNVADDASGVAGNATAFNGVNAYINAQSLATYASTGILTTSLWFKPAETITTTTNAMALMDLDDSISTRAGGIIFGSATGLLANEIITVYSTNATGTYNHRDGYCDPTSNLTAGTWYHLAVVFNGTDNLIYLNGARVDNCRPAGTTSPKVAAVPNSVKIGYVAGVSRPFFNGSIDEVKLLNRTLSAAEIYSYANGGYFNRLSANTTVGKVVISGLPVGTYVYSLCSNNISGASSCSSQTITLFNSVCVESWSCTSWTCSNGVNSRTCTDANHCGTTVNKPTETGYCGGSSTGGGSGNGQTNTTIGNGTSKEYSTQPFWAIFTSPINKTYYTGSTGANSTYAMTVSLASVNATSVWWNNGTANRTYSTSVTVNLTTGTYTWRAYANNTAGNVSTQVLTFYVLNAIQPSNTPTCVNIFNIKSMIENFVSMLPWVGSIFALVILVVAILFLINKIRGKDENNVAINFEEIPIAKIVIGTIIMVIFFMILVVVVGALYGSC